MLMMLPFEAPTIFENIPKPYFRMPRVVKDQRGKFENDDFFRQLSHEGAVKYTGFKDRPLEERQMKFIANCQEGHTEVSVVQSGNQFTLMFNPTANPAYNNEGCDFEKEPGKVHIKAGFILNGVCVSWRGWLDLQRLEGFGCLEFDEYRAYIEEAMLKQSIDKQATCNSNGQQNNNSSGYANLTAGLSVPSHHAHLSAVASIASNGGNGGMNIGGPLNGPLAPPTGLTNCSAMAGLAPPPPMPPHPLAGLGGGGGGGGPMGPPPQGMPPVSLTEAAASAHYGNAIAAAFHQALGVPTGLHGFGGADATTLAAAAAAMSMPPTTHLPPPYSNGTSNGAPPPQPPPPPPQQQQPPSASMLTQQPPAPLTSVNNNSNNHSTHHQQPLGPQAINSTSIPTSNSNNNNSNINNQSTRSSHQHHLSHHQNHRSPPSQQQLQVNGHHQISRSSAPQDQLNHHLNLNLTTLNHHQHHQVMRHSNKRPAPDTTELEVVDDDDDNNDDDNREDVDADGDQNNPDHQTQVDDVDVVSDSNIHSTQTASELDFAPPPAKRIFKSSSGHHNHNLHSQQHHHPHHHHQHRATRRA